MEKHVFISYKHDDSEFAENLIHRVEKEGFSTWIDNESLHGGDDWRDGIDQAIRSAFALIVVMSPDAKASEYVTYEWAFAWGCGIKVIPVMYRKTELHPRLGALQYLDFTNSIRPWERLMRTLKAAASKSLPSPFPVVPTISTEQKVQEWIDKGELFLKRQDYDAALEAFKQAILLDPSNAIAYAGKSSALWGLQKYQEVLGASQQAIRLDANIARAWNYKGNALSYFKRYEEGLSAYDAALHLDPQYALAWYNKGNTLGCLKRYDEALLAYEEAIRLDPQSARAWNNKGNALGLLKRYDEALLAYEGAIRIDPQYTLTWNCKGNVLYGLKKYEEALLAYEEALRLDPDDAHTWNNKGNTFKQLGRSEEAERCYKKARDLGFEEDQG